MYPFKEGGNLLFRPFGMISIVNVLCDLSNSGVDFDEIFARMEIIDLSLSFNIWNEKIKVKIINYQILAERSENLFK